MTREEIFALFNRREAAWQARDAASLTADHSKDGVVVSPTGGVLEGIVEIERIYRVWFTAFPDLVFTTEDLLVDENRVALLCRITGSHAGEFFGMPPTGRRIEVSGCFIYRLENAAHRPRAADPGLHGIAGAGGSPARKAGGIERRARAPGHHDLSRSAERPHPR